LINPFDVFYGWDDVKPLFAVVKTGVKFPLLPTDDTAAVASQPVMNFQRRIQNSCWLVQPNNSPS